MTIYSVYDQVADLLATIDPVHVSAIQATGEMQDHFDVLAEKSADGQLTKQEKDELDHYIVLERLMRLAKIRAKSSQTPS